MERCIEQYLLFNSADMYVLTDRANIPHLKKRPGVIPVALEDYHSDKVERFNAVFNYGPRDFWTVSTTRLIYLENFLRVSGLQHVCHFENDVLVYFNISNYASVFESLYSDLAVTPCDPDQHTTGFMYINDYKSLGHMTEFFIFELARLGVNSMAQQYGVHMINDMTLMKCYADKFGISNMKTLPVMPFGEHSNGYEQFGAIFDAAGWGQYVTGTRTDGPGITYAGHIVGGVLRAHPEYQVVWNVEDGLRFPYFSYDDRQAKLNSIHVHSKNMCLYMSKGCE